MFLNTDDDDVDKWKKKNRIRLGHIEAAILCITVCFSKEENKKFKSWDVATRIDLSDETLSTKIFYKPWHIYTPTI